MVKHFEITTKGALLGISDSIINSYVNTLKGVIGGKQNEQLY